LNATCRRFGSFFPFSPSRRCVTMWKLTDVSAPLFSPPGQILRLMACVLSRSTLSSTFCSETRRSRSGVSVLIHFFSFFRRGRVVVHGLQCLLKRFQNFVRHDRFVACQPSPSALIAKLSFQIFPPWLLVGFWAFRTALLVFPLGLAHCHPWQRVSCSSPRMSFFTILCFSFPFSSPLLRCVSLSYSRFLAGAVL